MAVIKVDSHSYRETNMLRSVITIIHHILNEMYQIERLEMAAAADCRWQKARTSFDD